MSNDRLNDDDGRITNGFSIERILAEYSIELQLKPSERFYETMRHAPWHQNLTRADYTSKKSATERLSSLGFVSATIATILILVLLIAFTPIGVYAKDLINFLLRAEENEITITITIPAQYTSIGTRSLEAAKFSIAEVQAHAGFDILQPNSLPDGFIFYGANYDERLDTIELYYGGQNDWFIITQKKGKIDFQRIGASATIHLIPIGDTLGEYVQGVWIVASDNESIIQTSLPGTEVALNAFWDSQLQQSMLRWKNGDILIEILSFSDQIDLEALIIIAESMHITP